MNYPCPGISLRLHGHHLYVSLSLAFRINSIFIFLRWYISNWFSRGSVVTLFREMSSAPVWSEWTLLLHWKSSVMHRSLATSTHSRLCSTFTRSVSRPQANLHCRCPRTNDNQWTDLTLETNCRPMDQSAVLFLHSSSSSGKIAPFPSAVETVSILVEWWRHQLLVVAYRWSFVVLFDLPSLHCWSGHSIIGFFVFAIEHRLLDLCWSLVSRALREFLPESHRWNSSVVKEIDIGMFFFVLGSWVSFLWCTVNALYFVLDYGYIYVYIYLLFSSHISVARKITRGESFVFPIF